MKERPIPFSAPMVRALLEGRKTQTRRVVEPQPPTGHNWAGWCVCSTHSADEGKATWAKGSGPMMQDAHRVRCRYGAPGDRLWVRETWRSIGNDDAADYRATYVKESIAGGIPREHALEMEAIEPWRPSIFMPRWASRILLEVTDVRVQRVQDINAEDALAEGVDPTVYAEMNQLDGRTERWPSYSPRLAFLLLWDSINAKRGYDWEANPWVWAITFRRIEATP